MKHKIFAQLLLLLCLVVSCSRMPIKVSNSKHTANKVVVAADENQSDEASVDDEKSSEESELSSIAPISGHIQNNPSFATASPEQRTAFLRAEQLLSQHDAPAFLAQMQLLKNYPLYSYLQSQWLRKNLTQGNEIASFLNSYKNNRYADLLRRDWLLWLAKNQQWPQFVQYYQEDYDAKKPALQCYFGWAQYNTGQQEQALTTAQELWLKNITHPACDRLFSVFSQSARFSEDLLWQRFSFSLRGKKTNTSVTSQLKQQMSPSAQKTADLWLKIHNNPALVAHPNQWDTQNPKAGDIFAHGVGKIANQNLSAAIGIWEAQKSGFNISSEAADYVNQKLGMALAAAGYSSYAYSRLIQANTLDENARHTLIRSALKEQNWQHIAEALTKLTADEKNQDKWQYWQGRAWAETGKTTEAQEIFATLSKKSCFYAFLAADKINKPYRVVHAPVPVTAQEVTNLQQQDDFKMVAEWFALGRKDEALRQWWYSIKKSQPKQIMAAAKLAQLWQMNKLAAFTIAKADYWQDLELRFPIAFTQEINAHALKQNLDPAIVFGLIRQESVFDEYAGSHAGAMGLMQIMPATGRQIARQLQEPWRSETSLYEPETNIRYGTFYYKQLLDKFNGQVALAAAGYNAGPGRVKQWLPDRAMPMDIWIETIPFNETRQYVGMVLSNALFYQQRMNRDVLKIADFMTDVQPLSASIGQFSANSY